MGADSKSQTPPTSQALCTTVATLALLLSIACSALHVYVLQDLQRAKGTSARGNILLHREISNLQQKMASYEKNLENPQVSALPSAGDRGNYTSHQYQNKTRVKRTAVGTGSVLNSACLQGLPGRDGRDGRDGPQGPAGSNGISSEELTDILSTFRETMTSEQSLRSVVKHNVTAGSVYVRWGRTVCPSSAALVYSGIAGGSHYSQSGGGVEKLCLPTTPQWGTYESGLDGNKYKSYIYGAEYQSGTSNIFSKANANGARLNQHDVPCAVCHSPHSSQLMIPALMDCPNTWTKEYNGYLMTERYNHQGRSSFDCVDVAPEIVQGGIQDQNGALFYFVEAVCGSLPCPNYVSGHELTCVVCTK